MHIERITVKNFRLLKDFSIDLEKGLSLVIGKNNVGKTSLLKVLDRFFKPSDKNKFQFNDFSLSFRKELIDMLEGELQIEKDYKPQGIFMRLLIKFADDDNIENLSRVLLSLDADNYYACIGFEYTLNYSNYLLMHNAFKEFQEKESKKVRKGNEPAAGPKIDEKAETSVVEADEKTDVNEPVISNPDGKKYVKRDTAWFIEKYHDKYFNRRSKTIYVSKDRTIDEKNYTDLDSIDNFSLKNLISFKYIDAKRNVDNKESENQLSAQTAKLYDLIESMEQKAEDIENLDDSMRKMDSDLSDHYSDLFKNVINTVRKFGGIHPEDTQISIVSSLSQRNLLSGNTTVRYRHNDTTLPENFNGLGYMNLISMIFEIERIRYSFARKSRNSIDKPADINLLFIEEPEAHTHPQLQYVFIKNIKDILESGVETENAGIVRPLQTIISTHSSHIVCSCDFDDIKYMLLDDNGYSNVRNIKELKDEFAGDKKAYAFLKQYLTLHRCELFFADKAIAIEGDTERILLPAMMKKVDDDPAAPKDALSLLSQNISVIEAGAYSHVFRPLFEFINLKKYCVITDIDICEKNEDTNGKPKKHKWQEDMKDLLVTSNSSLKSYFKDKRLVTDLYSLTAEQKILSWNKTKKEWEPNVNGNVRICFQTEENGYHARSFEDCFFHVNQKLLKDEQNQFDGLGPKALKEYRNGQKSIYELAEAGINSKSTLAADILYCISNSDGESEIEWNIPQYIKEGLLWLKQ